MSNKANWTAAIAGVVGSGVAVVTLFMPTSKIEQPRVINVVPPTIVRPLSSDNIPIKSTDNKEQKNTKNNCNDKFHILIDSAKSLSLTTYQDEAFKSILENAIQSICFDAAYIAASSLSLTTYKDNAFKRIYKAAIIAREYKIAKKAINKLSLTTYRDNGNKALLNAMRDET